MKLCPTICLVLVLTGTLSCLAQSGFVHPGLLHHSEDLNRMRQAVTSNSVERAAGVRSPDNTHAEIAIAFRQLEESPYSRADYRLRGPFSYWGRKPNRHSGEAASDATAAYQNALMWAITGKQAHADKAMQILNAWKKKLERVGGVDGVLAAGLQGFRFVNAAEILRHTDSGWSETDAQDAERWFLQVWHPTIKDYAHFANGNWETAALQTKMAIAVYCNDRRLFEESVRYAANGCGNGSIAHTVVHPTGQCQESTRKQHYAQLGLGLLSNAAEVAWNQGVDLYGWKDNRILKGFEYTAAYGLGKDVPYHHYLDRTGKYGFGGRHQHYVAISTVSRGNFRPIFEQPYNHYAKRRGLDTPNLAMVIARQRPEGYGGDHPSYGTVTHARSAPVSTKPVAPPGIPAGLVARSTDLGIRLTWVKSVEPVSCTDAEHYIVQRAKQPNGVYLPVATELSKPEFHDQSVEKGELYFYTVSAVNGVGESAPSWALAANAGMPKGWSAADVGNVGVPGYSEFNGTTFSLEGEGSDVGGTADEFHFAWKKLQGDGVITARIVQPMSSQWSKPGVMMRASLKSDSPHASVLLLPPKWSGALVYRDASGKDTFAAGVTKIPEPFVINENRLMKPYWIRLTRTGSTFTGFMSRDGTTWQKLASANAEMPDTLYVGLPACSQLNHVTTRVTYDHVSVTTEAE